LRRGLGGGSNGSISVHNSSSMIGASIPWVPLFRRPRLTACRESKQPPQGVFELASKGKPAISRPAIDPGSYQAQYY
jgi:hypothetical protein